ncbi:grass carp reovirus (GCRV)-induced gene 2o [Labeo rohita]|uniref:grass carp reovirus (GCRV)-induced gene 2o n=1 Tax=Labeo rohita TaxID=84645 RepID=UPI0021E217F5|nr:grass carp reovirus (GCRV)-induced gene 2o [Labeo rohita]XP_050966610.1 grass carp reovirus (GCRV)-induced gene 2o [Labeo rohita]XP_050966611.1 grass carp reovirus (GCRV)-induced gene 2o [Labeo rohita]XP_050966612.1 grass carp reovirus (GCRV)-induced gene 2o [Labeo rohita]
MERGVFFCGWKAVTDRKSLSENQEPKSGRVYTMYHGTHLSNAKTIINEGFEPSKTGMLGRGVYVSRNIKKAKCYPLNTDKNDKVVFKLKVRVGKVKKIDCDNHELQKSWHENGYDCAWVPPHSNISSIKSGREEDCVWDPKRITVIDVACCVDDAKRKELRRMIRSKLKTEGCSLCHVNASDSHDIERCWECQEDICPFQSKHVCKGRKFREGDM